MLVIFTDDKTDTSLAINPNHVVAVFIVEEKTVINMLNGNAIVKEDYNTVVGLIQGELK